MFKVAFHHLAPDARTAGAAYGELDVGDVAAEVLRAFLENFRTLDALQNHEAEPCMTITARAGRFVVRTSGERLFLYDARDLTRGCTELTTEELIAQLDRPAENAPAPAIVEPPLPTRRAPLHGSISIAMLAAGLALNGYTLYSAFYVDDINRLPPLTLLTDPAEITRQQEAITGTYATGTEPGDRRLTLTPDGQVSFQVIGARAQRPTDTDSYRLGRHEQKLLLATAHSGHIEVLNRDTLLYYGDTYRRSH